VNGPDALAMLQGWTELGWLRRLDTAFARFMLDLCPAAPAPLVVAAALLAHLEGRGHSCLLLDELLHDAEALLGWPAASREAWSALMAHLPAATTEWIDALRASPLVREDAAAAVAAPGADQPPLVLHGARLYLRRYWNWERRVAAQVRQRVASSQAVDEQAVRTWLDRLFPPADPPATDWQKLACGLALRGRLTIVTGGPGTGKTYTAARLLALLYAIDAAPECLRVALAAPTGKAAARLRQSIDAALVDLQPLLADRLPLHDLAIRIGPARTLHALLGAHPGTRRLRHDAAHPLALDVVIVDEASMVHLEMMAALLQALPPQARLVLLGDKDQLASVEAGAVLGDLCRDAEQGHYRPRTVAYALAVTGQALPADCHGDGPPLAQQTVMLRTSRRFGGPIGELAAAVNRGDGAAALTLLHAAEGPSLHWLDAPAPPAIVRLALAGRAGAAGGYGAYLQVMAQRPRGDDPLAFETWVMQVLTTFDRFRLLCAVREGDWGAAGLNVAVERALVAAGRLGRRSEWYEGRPVMVTRNDPGLGVFNGDVGITLRPLAPGAPLRVHFQDGSAVRSVAVSRLSSVETAYAMTVHKSQGSEFDHAVLVLPHEASRVLTRELVYTGITRARSAFTLVAGSAQAFAAAVAQRTRRTSGLQERLGAADDPAAS